MDIKTARMTEWERVSAWKQRLRRIQAPTCLSSYLRLFINHHKFAFIFEVEMLVILLKGVFQGVTELETMVILTSDM